MTHPPEPSQHLDRACAMLAHLHKQARREHKTGKVQVQIDYQGGTVCRVRHYIEGVELTHELALTDKGLTE